ncbi:hypothetical protein QOT17_005197 [Balamuthia mandrillaris]
MHVAKLFVANRKEGTPFIPKREVGVDEDEEDELGWRASMKAFICFVVGSDCKLHLSNKQWLFPVASRAFPFMLAPFLFTEELTTPLQERLQKRGEPFVGSVKKQLVGRRALVVTWVAAVLCGASAAAGFLLEGAWTIGGLAAGGLLTSLLWLLFDHRRHRFMFPKLAPMFLIAMALTLVAINVVTSLRFMVGVEQVFRFERGMNESEVERAADCGRGLVSLGVTCKEHTFPGSNWAALPWALYLHIFPSAFALCLGPLQLFTPLRRRCSSVHRWVGRVYALCAVVGFVGCIPLLLTTNSGLLGMAGFLLWAIGWMVTLVWGVVAAWSKSYATHRGMVLRNYALTFSSVTFRLSWPLLRFFTVNQVPAYQISAWIGWMLNWLAVEMYLALANQKTVKPLNDNQKKGQTKASKEQEEESSEKREEESPDNVDTHMTAIHTSQHTEPNDGNAMSRSCEL